MLGLYKELEHYTGHDDGSGAHGICGRDTGGSSGHNLPSSSSSRGNCNRLTTTTSQYIDEVSSAFLEAASAAGLEQCSDFNDHHKEEKVSEFWIST